MEPNTDLSRELTTLFDAISEIIETHRERIRKLATKLDELHDKRESRRCPIGKLANDPVQSRLSNVFDKYDGELDELVALYGPYYIARDLVAIARNEEPQRGKHRSPARDRLLEILKTRTRVEVAREINCPEEFVSMVASGKRIPSRWRLLRRIHRKLKIEPWEWLPLDHVDVCFPKKRRPKT
jgi:hypothetical protein